MIEGGEFLNTKGTKATKITKKTGVEESGGNPP